MRVHGAILHARVLPMTTPDAQCQAVAWKDGRIVATGTDGEIAKIATWEGLDILDGQGRLVLPGFVDAHMHLMHVGLKGTRPWLGDTKSRQEMLDGVAQWLLDHPGDGPVTAEGWDEARWPDRQRPTRQDLDNVCPDRPLVARRVCGHVAVANSAALPLIEQHWSGPDVDAQTGLLLEEPSLHLNEAIPEPQEALDRAVEVACKTALKLGVTTVAAYEQAPARAAFQRAAAEGRLPVRIVSNIYFQQLKAEVARGFFTGRPGAGPGDDASWLPPVASDRTLPAQGKAQGGETAQAQAAARRRPTVERATSSLDGGEAAGPPSGGRDGVVPIDGHWAPVGGSSPWFFDGGVKLFLDGSLGGHTALLRDAYDDHPGCRGMANFSPGQIVAWFRFAQEHRVQVHAHAIGDGAIEQGLEAYEQVLGQGNPLRHRFEHYEIAPDDLVARTAKLGIVPCCQPNFVGVWSSRGGMYEDRLGKRFLANNRYVSFEKAGLRLAFGSDGMPLGPLYGLSCALHHPDPEERLDIRRALWLYTHRAAWSLHQEQHVGSLAPGLWADIVLIDGDLGQDPKDWRIDRVWTGGEQRS